MDVAATGLLHALLTADDAEAARVVNRNSEHLNRQLFSHLDYAAIAYRA